jgi:hypothetical protein
MSAPAHTPTQQAHDYLAAVERELDDLPAEERTALLEDLAPHLEALGAEDDDRPVAVRLGPPAAYAADLRSAAGLPARAAATRGGAPALAARLDAARASLAVRRLTPAARQVGRLLAELRPAWWVLRGYLVVLVPCLHTRDGVSDFPVPAPLGSHLLGGLLVVAALVGSVALGRRQLPRPVRLLVAALGIAILVASYVAWDRSDLRRGMDLGGIAPPPTQAATGKYPLLSRHGPVTDVLPYAADGTLLEGVLLYDQDGRPLRVGLQEWWADGCARVLDQPLAADGVPVPHSFPLSYEVDRVLEPNALGVDGNPRPMSSCDADVARPDVPLPVFPAGSVAPDPGN